MTDREIREYFELADDVDLDKPRFILGFMTYREMAQRDSHTWGFVSVDNFR